MHPEHRIPRLAQLHRLVSVIAFAVVITASAGLILNNVAAQDNVPGDLMIERGFDFDAGQSLVVDVGDADLVVNTGRQGSTEIRIYLAGRNMSRARDYFDRQNFSVSENSQGVVVRTQRDRSLNWTWGRTGSARITVVADIPTTANVDLVTSDGDIDLGDVEGEVSVRTSDGDLQFATIRSSSVSLRSSDGDITGDVIVAGAVHIKTSDGDLRLRQIEAESIEAGTNDGDIFVGASFGDASIRTSDGDIEIDHMEGRALSARTSDGDITVDEVVAGKAMLHSSDGNIKIARAEGSIDATTSDGDIRVGLTKPAAMDLRTSDGSVTLSIPDGMPANLELAGRSVNLSSDFGFDGNRARRSAKGSINGGGELIRARASDGTVTVRPGSGR